MKLHLGCGKRFIKGLVHIDAIDFPHVDHVAQIDQLPFIPDDSVDLIYSAHVLEHFKRNDYKRVLSEWRRVLRTGGRLRLAVPDFEAICRVYLKYKNIEMVKGLIYGGQDYIYNIHYNTFDFESLSDDLEELGFDNIHRYDWRQTEHADVDDFSQAYLPHMDKENGCLVSLNVECTKKI